MISTLIIRFLAHTMLFSLYLISAPWQSFELSYRQWQVRNGIIL